MTHPTNVTVGQYAGDRKPYSPVEGDVQYVVDENGNFNPISIFKQGMWDSFESDTNSGCCCSPTFAAYQEFNGDSVLELIGENGNTSSVTLPTASVSADAGNFITKGSDGGAFLCLEKPTHITHSNNKLEVTQHGLSYNGQELDISKLIKRPKKRLRERIKTAGLNLLQYLRIA
jgi:RNA recognition motif-containing protein